MWRWIVNITAAVSVLLLIGICVLWVRSYSRTETYVWFEERGAVAAAVQNVHGWVMASRMRLPAELMAAARKRNDPPPVGGYTAEPDQGPPDLGEDPQPPGRAVRFLGIVAVWYSTPDASAQIDSLYLAYIPHYWLLLPCLPFPLIWLRRWRRRRLLAWRAGLGLCRACGYDLRASPERCPECGTVK